MLARAHDASASRRLYRLQLILGVAGLSATAAALAVGVDSVQIAPAGGQRLVIAGLRFSYPEVNAAAGVLLALAVLGAAVLAVAVRAGWRQLRASRAFLGELRVVGALGRYPTVTVVDDHSPQAFCAGYLRPRVYVSSGALELLSEPELTAVLAHEHQHAASRDPLRLACGRVLSEALFFMPVLRRLHHRYGDLAELTADAAAVRAAGGAKAPLASALLTFGSHDSDDVVGISPERVDSLLGRAHPWSLPSLLVMGALATLAAPRCSGAPALRPPRTPPSTSQSSPPNPASSCLPSRRCSQAPPRSPPDARSHQGGKRPVDGLRCIVVLYDVVLPSFPTSGGAS